MTADPTAGSPAGIRSLATALQQDATAIRSASSRTSAEAGSVSDADWTGAAKGSFVSTAGDVAASAERTATHVDNAVSALLAYATRIEQIQRDAAVIAAQQQHTADQLSLNAKRADKLAGSDDVTDAVQLGALAGQQAVLQTTKAALERSWDDLVSQRKAADAQAVSALGTTDVVGVIPPSTAAVNAMSGPELLAYLKGLHPEELAALAGNTAIADKLAALDDPDAVAKWWSDLGGEQGKGSYDDHSAAQDALLAAFPAAMGNLNGVAYWARDTANRTELQRQKAASDKRLADLEAAVADAVAKNLRPYDLASKLEDERQLNKQLENFASAARGSQLPNGPEWQNVRVQVVSFTAGKPPLGAISLGNLDTVDNVSYVVPGMGTTMGDSTVLQRAARNIKEVQDGITGDPSETAVVAWVNYDTPVMATVDPFEVLSNKKAEAGAERLVDDLSGFRASRGDSPVLNVVGHSYGTTTASIALSEDADLHVQSFVSLGSAGIPTSIHSADDIHAEHVYAGTGDESVAPLGRWGSRRTDPSDADFGAEPLGTGSDDVNVPGLGSSGSEKGVTVHDPLKHVDAGDPYGYLDRKTSSVFNTGVATLAPW
ncbi:hypothetical protein BIU97_03985 [Curtobacterium sp. MCBA15_009]|uniref:alpha/beta hydrolase n=1 Tax=Curtobacterium sp. MCBA15_009 TaxID=1898737 RepID=UPI0008DD1BA7|nr:alpha/beta hydrolase [Curtobacterium sp. MCBA15_009]OII13085.1 hypothetical protein BIU97_03985 [Curtobacterium sp. MCBA15_009]